MRDPTDLDAVRAAYDAVAATYTDELRMALAGKPFDRTMLLAYAYLVKATSSGRVADLGCGPGHVTAFLEAQGLRVFGVDLSSRMLAAAKHEYPALELMEASMEALGFMDGVLGGVIAWYSIIHTPPEHLPAMFDEFSRVLVDGGYLALTFQVGNERMHIDQGYGHVVSLDAYRLDPEVIAGLLSSSSLMVEARLIRQPDESEKVQQAYLIARKSTGKHCATAVPQHQLSG
jgi:SAM-dependent methyltransferase